MPTTRRLLIAAAATFPAWAASRPASAEDADPRMAERSMGAADAKVVVNEWFSMTCTHCAAFQKETFPAIRSKLIDTGRVRRWAFARGVNSTDELAKYAALAGMSRPTFNTVIADAALKNAILAAQAEAEKSGVDSTPTFFMNGKPTKGAVSYADFEKAVDAAVA